MIKNKIIALIPFLILLIIPCVYAIEDFKIVGTHNIEISECIKSETDKILIINTGDVESNYIITAKGSAAKFLSLGPTNFVLMPGQLKNISTYFSVPCGKKGKYDLEFDINTESGLTKTFKQKIVVKKLQNIELLPVTYAGVINPCDNFSYQFNLKNTGPFEETYTLKFEKPFNKYIGVNFNQVILKPNQEVPLYIYITPPCNFYGNYTIPFSIKVLNTKLYAETFTYLMIERAYDYSLKLGKIYPYNEDANLVPSFIEQDRTEIYGLCMKSKQKIPVKIKNNANLKNTYNINLKSPGWVKLSEDNFELDKGQEKIIELNIDTFNVKGDFNVVIDVLSEFGDIKKTENITLSIENCYEPHISTLLYNKKKIVLDYTAVNVPLNLKNIGSKTADYTIILDSETWIDIEPKSLKVAPGENKTLNLVSSPSESVSRGTYKANIQIKIDNTNIKYEDSLKISLVTMNLFDKFYYNFLIPYIWYLIIAIVLLILILTTLFVIIKKNKKKIKAYIKKLKVKKERKKTVKQAEKRIKTKTKIGKFKKIIILILSLILIIALFTLVILLKPGFRQVLKDFFVVYWLYFVMGIAVLLVIIALLFLIKIISAKTKSIKSFLKKLVPCKRTLTKIFNRKTLFWTGLVIVLAAIAFLIYYFALWKPFTNSNNISIVKEYLVYTKDKLIFILGSVADFFVKNVNYILYTITGLIIILLLIVILRYLKKQRTTHAKISSADKQIVLKNKKIAFGEIIIKLKRGVSDVELLLKKVRKPTFIRAGDFVYEYIDLKKDNLEKHAIDSVIVRFKVKKSWLKRKNIKKNDISLKRYTNTWNGINTRIIDEDKKYYYYESILNHLSFFAIVGKKSEKPVVVKEEKPTKIRKILSEKKIKIKNILPKKRIEIKINKTKLRKIFWFALILIIILIIIGLGYYFGRNILPLIMYYEFFDKGNITEPIIIEEVVINETLEQQDLEIIEEEQIGISNQEWDKNTVQTIDLSKYFSDPDMDKLYYSNTELQNINIDYKDNKAVLTPLKNWHGSEFVIFTADDMKGGKVESNLVKLTVKDVSKTSLFIKIWDWISK